MILKENYIANTSSIIWKDMYHRGLKHVADPLQLVYVFLLL
jgi:hypothetical protein